MRKKWQSIAHESAHYYSQPTPNLNPTKVMC